MFVTRREIEWRASHRRRRSSKVSQSLGGRIRVVGLASGEERGSSCGTVSPRGGEWVVGESNQPDRSSCFRSFARSFPLSPSHSLPLPPQPSYSFRGEHCRGATIDTWRGGGGGRGGGERVGGGGRRGWRLIFCSLASASSSASGRGVANPANGLERSTIHHLRSFVRVANLPPSSPSFLRSFTLRPLFSPPLFISPFSLLLFEGRRNRLLFRVKAFCVSQRVGATS